MSARTGMLHHRTTVAASGIVLLAIFWVNMAQAADRSWSNPAGGTFSNAANWQGGVAPTAADNAVFDLDAPDLYTVTLSAPAAVTQLLIDRDQVLLDLASFGLTASSTGFTLPSLTVAGTAGTNGSLELRNGTLTTATAGISRIGDFGNGTLTLANGAKWTGTGYLAFRDGSTGTVNISGAGSTWTADGQYVGNGGTGTLAVSAGGSVVTNEASYIGLNAASHGDATVTGPGSSWTGSKNYLTVGYGGHGTLTVNDRGLISSQSLKLGANANSVGLVNLDGATGATARSTIAVSGAQSAGVMVGDNGSGTLNVTNGALLTDGGTFWIGYEPGSSGVVNVSGAAGGNNAEIRVTGMMTIARSIYNNPGAGGGNGSLTVGAGGSVTISGASYLGSTGVGAGAGTIKLDGGTFTTHGLSVSAGSAVIHNAGTMIINGGAYAPAVTSLALAGATASDTATLRLTNAASLNLPGALYLG
ncbi:MAG TPA: hypothetical protein VH475_00540, partial [Tepidisphaeraceae bacterium]